jgi:hypothetical protein
MPKSKNRKQHAQKLAKYKVNKKKEQEVFKKKMIEHYMKMQQEAIANKETHTSTEEVVGPEVNLDELNQIEPWEPETAEETITLDEPIIDIEAETEIYKDDNNNQ